MKMITAIVNKKDAGSVCDALTKEGYFFTKMATTGGFLKAGNTTLLIGTDNDKVTAAVEIIRKNCAQRMQMVPTMPSGEGGYRGFNYFPTEVLVGGATVFVTEVEYYEKM